MSQAWKKFFFLNFEKAFFTSCSKLLLVWNPLWTFIVTVVLEAKTLWPFLFDPSQRHPDWLVSIFDSAFFSWRWNLFKATIVCFLGMAFIWVYLGLERAWARGVSKEAPRHGTGWYLLFLAFLAPPGLIVALHLMVGIMNLFTPGDPMTITVPWQYYGTETFWVWALLLVSFIFKYWQDLRDSVQQNRLRAEALEKERLQALLTNLKDQMNPHFLFNTLNTVASLIPADPSKAEQVVVMLSTLYQGVLASTRKINHSLEKELEFCGAYLDIEKVRFGNRLSTFIEVAKGLDPARAFIPVLLLQPLVENAVKHGLSSRASGGRIWIKASLNGDRLEMQVEDDGVGFGNSRTSGSGTALENCRKRLELAYGKNGGIEITPRSGGGTRVKFFLPLLTSETELGADFPMEKKK